MNHILPYVPQHYNTYIEPFIGSGSIFLKLKPQKWIINDINEYLIILWSLIKSNPEIILKRIDMFSKQFNELENKKQKLMFCRDLTSRLGTKTVENAINFLILKSIVYLGYLFIKNKYHFSSFNFQANQNDIQINKPYYAKIVNNIHSFMGSSSGRIFCDDYKNILKKARENDFVFLDPPYVEDHDYHFQYNNKETNNNDIISLYKEILKLDKKRVLWIMTQADTQYVRDIFKNYRIVEYPVYRRSQMKYKNELLILSPLIDTNASKNLD